MRARLEGKRLLPQAVAELHCRHAAAREDFLRRFVEHLCGVLPRWVAVGVADARRHAEQLHQPRRAGRGANRALLIDDARISEARQIAVYAVHQVNLPALRKQHHGGGRNRLGLAVQAEDAVAVDQPPRRNVGHARLRIEHFLPAAPYQYADARAFLRFDSGGENIGDLFVKGHENNLLACSSAIIRRFR